VPSGVEVLRDEVRDRGERLRVVARDLDRVSLAGAEGHAQERRAGKPVGVFGEAAADPALAVLGRVTACSMLVDAVRRVHPLCSVHNPALQRWGD
jgi:hypothetical protein